MEGDTLTNLQLGDPDSESTIVRVEVEAGSGPLTIFLHSETPVIWDFEGAVEQVEHAFIVTREGMHTRKGTQRAASRGLPEKAVKFPDLTGCPFVILPPWAKADNNVELYFGRSADHTVFEGKPKVLKLPAGEFVRTQGRPPNAATGAEREIFMYHPGGFRLIDAKSVVSPLPVLEPETYPAEAGLFQLAMAGAIRPPKQGEIDGFVEAFRRQYPSKIADIERTSFWTDYVITREIMLPPGLFGGHLKNFLVLPGVPAPRGNAGHGCVILMDGYRSNNGAHCGGILKE